MISIRRVYDQDPGEGEYKLLVDRLWPRGISREAKPWDEWIKEIAPDPSLRKWFHHDPQKWEAFQKEYLFELHRKEELLLRVKKLEAAYHHLTLLYAAKDREHNHAVVLRQALTEMTLEGVDA